MELIPKNLPKVANNIYWKREKDNVYNSRRIFKKLFELKDSLIKVVTGVRGCGKSTLFVQFQDYLIKRGILKE